MPLYLYRCEQCSSEFETLVTRHNRDSVACPSCASAKVVQGFGAPAKVAASPLDRPTLNCRGDGPPCGAVQCGRTIGRSR